jgi:hypothetical protein
MTERSALFPRSQGVIPWHRSSLDRRVEAFEPNRGLMIAGLIALGLGALAWYYVGHDVKRYIRIRNM